MAGKKASYPYPWYVDELAVLPMFLFGVTVFYLRWYGAFKWDGMIPFILTLISCQCGVTRRKQVNKFTAEYPP